MDNLKTLMDKKQYDLVIQLTENSNNPNDIFFRISALLATGKGKDALSCLLLNKKALKSDMALLMKVHIELLCLLGKFEDAYIEMKHYEDEPYVSQEVEELIQSLPGYIRAEERKTFASKELDNQKIIEKLKSDSVEDVIAALDIARERDLNVFLKPLQDLMINHPQQSIRSFGLLMLVQKQTNQVFKFNHLGEIIDVNPSLIEPPFVGEPFNSLTKLMQKEYRNPSLSQTAIQLLSGYIIYIYPEKLHNNSDLYLAAFHKVSSEMLNEPDALSREEIIEKYQVDENEFDELVKKINDSVNNF